MADFDEPTPPNYLVDMRKINDGIQVPDTPGTRKLIQLRDADYDKFLSRWMAAEDKWRAQTGKPKAQAPESPVPGGTPEPEEPDEGTEQVEQVIERLLEEAKQ